MITQTCIANHLKSQQIYQRSPHFHDINEIIYTLNDESSIFLGSHTYKINRGALILVPEGIIHRKSNPTDTIVDTYTIHYPKSLLSSYSTPNTDLTRIFGNTATCIQLPENEIARITRLF
jgi:oxalate decarboxylase/phosphoglucose isomerase-like protein (cupin superfamily)